jgi:hypothetical protein
MCNNALASEEIPDHMIVWIDLGIGKPGDYQRLKAAFSSTTDPQHVNPISLFNKSDEEINRTVGFEQVNFEGVRFLLAAFTNIERCVEFLQENSDKRIFLITSGQMGRAAVPLIIHKCQNIFTDPVTQQPYAFIYVYCHGIDRNWDWMLNFRDYLAPPFTHDADLLVRMIRDIANYFVEEGRRYLAVQPQPNYSAAYNRLTWAHTLYDRYRTMQGDPLKNEFAEVNQLLDKAEKGMTPISDNEH